MVKRCLPFCFLGLGLAVVIAPAQEITVYENTAEAIWGHWGHVYAQSFVAPTPCWLLRATFNGTSKAGQFTVDCAILDAASGRLVSSPMKVPINDDAGGVAAWRPGEVGLKKGHRYVLRLEGDRPWAAYASEGGYPEGFLSLDGGERDNKDLLATLIGSPRQPLTIASVTANVQKVSLPASDNVVTLSVTNEGDGPVQVVEEGLTLRREGQEVTDQYWIEPAPDHPHVLPPGETVEFRYTVETFHDTDPGEIVVQGRVVGFDLADNRLVNGSFEEATTGPPDGWAWTGEGEEGQGGYALEQEAGHYLPWEGKQSLRFTLAEQAPGGSVCLDSSPVEVLPETTYVAGVWYRSDRAGLESPFPKEIVVVERDEAGEPLAHHYHRLYEMRDWTQARLRFTTRETCRSVVLSLRMHRSGPGESASVWWDGAYLVQASDLLEVSETEHPLRWRVEITPETYRLADGTPSPLAFGGDDRATQGDWPRRYGAEGYVLCAMSYLWDVFGWSGQDSHVGNPDTTAETGQPRPLHYRVRTGDPHENVRCWQTTWSERRALYTPISESRYGLPAYRHTAWDDGGEQHPFDNQGPDLILSLSIPEGKHVLSLYFCDYDWGQAERPRRHQLIFRNREGQELLRLNTGLHREGVYKRVVVQGPLELEVRILKGHSVTASLSGFFLDPVPPVGSLYRAMMDLWTETVPPEAGPPAGFSEALESLREAQETAGLEFYRNRAVWQGIQAWAQRMASEAATPTARAEAWLGVAEAGQQLGEYDELAHAFAQAMAVAQTLLKPDTVAERAAQEADRAFGEKRFFEASLWADARLAALQKMGPWTKVAEAARELAWQYRFVDRRYATGQLARWLELTQRYLPPEPLKEALLAEARYWHDHPRRCRDYAIRCWEAARARFGPGVLNKNERLDLGRAYLDLNADDRARREFEQLLEGGERDDLTAEAHFLLALCELRANRPEKAKEMYFQILERYPNSPVAEAAAQTLERRFYPPAQAAEGKD